MAYGWAVAFGTLHSILTALAAWMLFFVTTFHWENQTMAEAASDDWLSVLAVAWFACAFVVFAGVMTARLWLVVPAVAAGAIIGVFALRYALVEWSDHGDTELVAFALGVGAAGFLAVLLTAKAARKPIGA
jgi:hypothetical protein